MKKNNVGFTLIELMTVVALVAILAMIALPSYQQYIRKAKRSVAQQYMMEMASRQEQYRLDQFKYTLDLTGSPPSGLGTTMPSEISGKYTFVATSNTTPPLDFTITATAQGDQVADGGPLTLTNTGVKGPAELWK
jgi:type IV pilus assembly protein PilE